eukprot:TRINITY_DN64628_c0_g1_i1.p1 TRINITY_DN64628_c0_g1~~TRINITY_DN64628_c0_g1_i1.p1  ORF type:complete len:227 (+),score=38.92 TRINITY_DN64628_c0_g1_i1:71-751(+)
MANVADDLKFVNDSSASRPPTSESCGSEDPKDRRPERKGSEYLYDYKMTPAMRKRRRDRIHSVHCYITRTSIAAVAASALILSGEDGETDPASSPSAGRRLTNMMASLSSYLCNALSGLAEAIGRPPRMPLQEQDTPAALLWAVDLSILAALATLAFFVLAFSAQSSAEDESLVTEEPLKDSEIVESFSEKLLYRIRVVLVMVVSALSGGLLNVKHLLRHALFLGI